MTFEFRDGIQIQMFHFFFLKFLFSYLRYPVVFHFHCTTCFIKTHLFAHFHEKGNPLPLKPVLSSNDFPTYLL